jgi:hypothetical protein
VTQQHVSANVEHNDAERLLLRANRAERSAAEWRELHGHMVKERNSARDELRGVVEALSDLLDCTDHRTLNEQMVGGDECLCGPCTRARDIVGGRYAGETSQ